MRAGSSPHMRGTLFSRAFRRTRAGIIPAYAGNTALPASSATASRDHPRICGEHDAMAGKLLYSLGSSPHMRGTLLSYRKRANFLGIIPAYAGNTRAPVSPWAPDGDHPRICGEHYNFMDCAFLGWGSSPHMRGTHAFNLANGLIGGIIPAYAGNTSRIIRSALGIWDHPRICGEHH